ncbi:MAG: biotin/lipoyl-containing protein [bacterium]
MAELNNCILPDDLHYSVGDNVWVRELGDGNVELGMTDIAQTMAGNIIHCRPKKMGASVKKGKSVATVESGKWVGPVKSPFAGEIVARNDAVEADASLINRSPYVEGWMVRINPEDLEGGLADLVQGEAAIEGFRAYMEAHEVSGCIHCEGFDG